MSSFSNYADINMKYNQLQKKHKNQINSNKKSFLNEARIKGFRSIGDARLEFKSPITAISGPNGTGKTSALHLMLCAYRPSDNSEIFSSKNKILDSYVSRYFPAKVEPIDPFRVDSEVSYKYVRKGESNQTLKIYRAKTKKSTQKSTHWDGYKRRPVRDVYYIGMSTFIPKIEKRDFSNNNTKASVLGKSNLSDEITKSISRVMGRLYSKSFLYNVKHDANGSVINLVGLEESDGIKYTENNMGFGEARIAYIVEKMQSASDESLFILDEPEVSLHGEAQHRFVEYLIDVCYEKNHQVIMTTHSRDILETLGPESLMYLTKTYQGGVKVQNGLDSYMVEDLHCSRTLIPQVIVCEDKFAEKMIRIAFDRQGTPSELLRNINFVPVGNIKNILQSIAYMTLYGGQNIKTIGILDGDMGEKEVRDAKQNIKEIYNRQDKWLVDDKNTKKYPYMSNNISEYDNWGNPIYFLPGKLPPEEEVFQIEYVPDNMADEVKKSVQTIKVSTSDPHQYFKKLSKMHNVACDRYEDKFIESYWDKNHQERDRLLESIISCLFPSYYSFERNKL